MPNREKPRMGDMVVYVWPVKERQNNNRQTTSPAMVVHVLNENIAEDPEDPQERFVNLQVFPDGPGPYWKQSIRYSEDKEQNTWHWMPTT